MQSPAFSEYNSLKSFNRIKESIDEGEENKAFIRLKDKADRSFNKSRYAKAYKLYKEALDYDENNYDIIACIVGVSLNLGFLDEVFDKTLTLIRLDDKRSQVRFFFFLKLVNLVDFNCF
jgi:tetratricopeptide (TPR) repeat protein